MRSIRTFIALFVAACWSLTAHGQLASADDYFNKAGKQYVKEDKAAALRTLDQGLRQYPGDPRLLKLAEELLKDEQQKQKQQQQQQQQQQEQQQKEKEQQQKEQQKKQEEQQRDQEQQAEEKEQDPEHMKPEPGRIAPQDAERILDALERNEKEVQAKVRERLRPARRVPVEKDW